jgi:hypothetical protein
MSPRRFLNEYNLKFIRKKMGLKCTLFPQWSLLIIKRMRRQVHAEGRKQVYPKEGLRETPVIVTRVLSFFDQIFPNGVETALLECWDYRICY